MGIWDGKGLEYGIGKMGVRNGKVWGYGMGKDRNMG